MRKRIGEYLIDAGLIDEKALAEALKIQKVQRKKIGQIFIDMGVADGPAIAKALAGQLEIPLLHLKTIEIPEPIISLVSPELARKHCLVPIKKMGKGLLVVMADPMDLSAVDDLRFVTRMAIEIAVAPQEDVFDALDTYYPRAASEEDLDSDTGMDDQIEIVQRKEVKETDMEDIQSLLALTERPQVVRIAQAIIAEAIKLKASDIHIEPQKTSVIIRYRIDGIMRETMKTDKNVHAPLVSRIKVISNMDLSIRRKPQDGKTQAKYKDKIYDLRVSTIPTAYGEKVTIRILDPDAGVISLKDLGFSEKSLRDLENALSRPQGMILVTGPTGSGKSSTLYACLNRLNSQEVNIVTVEDPIEYDMRGINQIQINPKAGITFASGLRSILRQDPDIVMVGEIRDSETAAIAFNAAQTGHLVLSTLHTNDALSAITRLLDLGVETFLISASLVAVVGQRLVRKICQECKSIDSVSPQILNRFSLYMEKEKSPVFWKGVGCHACQKTGYSGRLGLFEVQMITPYLRGLIVPDVSSATLKEAAEKEGFEFMSLDGIKKSLQGLTTVEEVLRVAPPEAGAFSKMPDGEGSVPEETRPEVGPSERHILSLGRIGPYKILVADDNKIVRKTLRKVLENENHRVITAEDGLEAMKQVMQEKPDLIITDFLMPKMDGMTLIKKLRSQSVGRNIPIIMLTAKDEVDFEIKGIDAGADDYLIKPVNPKRLLVRINRLLRRTDFKG